MYCSKCGTALAEGAAFCSACGAPVAGTSAAAPVVVPEPETPSHEAPPAPAVVALHKPVHYAGFWLRLVAFVIDMMILFVLLTVVVAFLAIAMGLSAAIQQVQPGETPERLAALLGTQFLLAVLLIALLGTGLYFSLLEASPWQATLGKRALGLYVTDLSGNKIAPGRARWRFFAGKFMAMGVPAFGIVYYFISCLAAGVTERKQAIHDMLTGCLVLRRV